MIAALLLAAAPVTPDAVSHAIMCSPDNYAAIANVLYTPEQPRLMTHVQSDPGSGMLGMDAYRLKRPITVFGRSVDRIYLRSDWITIALPAAEARALVRTEGMTRAPIGNTEQYYRFIDPEHGPMLGAFAGDDGLLLRAFGVPADKVPMPDTIYVGCNYTPASEARFLALAREADAISDGVASELRDMTEPGGKTGKR